MKAIKILAAGLILFLFACGGKGTGSGDDLSLRITPETLTIDRYDEVTIAVEIDNVKDLFVIGFDLMIDSPILEIKEITVPQTGIMGDDYICFYEEINEGLSISVGHTQTGGNDNFSGSGTVCEFKIIWYYDGDAYLELKNIGILNDSGQNVPGLSNIKTNISRITINR